MPSAESMAIKDAKIIAVGSNIEMSRYRGDHTQVIDMKGKLITPGFIDCHVHLMMGGRSLLSVDLRDAKTSEEFTRRIAHYATTLPKGAWILEGNWDHTLWGGTLPTKDWIDPSTHDNPVAVVRLDGHMILANSTALALAGIDKNTPDIEGGEIVKDKNGIPTGILKDNAMNLIYDKIPTMSTEQMDQNFTAAMNYFSSHGVTTVHDVEGLNPLNESYATARQLKNKGTLTVRIYGAKPLSQWEEMKDSGIENDEWIKVGCLKGFVDGSLGSHTAAFKEAYSDKPSDSGFFINSEENLYQWISGADSAGYQLFIHAIGDHAIESLLNIFDRVVKENGVRDRRLRIEHAQHIAPSDIKRFADMGVIASMQPYHAIDDGRWAEELIGAERIKTTYAFNSLIDAKAKVAFGSDWPVAPASPLLGIYAAVTRRTLDDKNPEGWVPEQKITVEQALYAYTRDAAFASFDEEIKGTLESGKLADFVVLSDDITKINPVEIQNVKILETYVGGKKVYSESEN